jgi:hypothetical protein
VQVGLHWQVLPDVLGTGIGVEVIVGAAAGAGKTRPPDSGMG